ncbi:MAG: hypothetical protein EU530_10950 [Promethearchaeota archaeon]|nr:MAG: hypothetical protein EU530_10950 [Candidatus Lokiarchaeota archaeon]
MSKKLEMSDKEKNEKWKSDVKKIFSNELKKNPDAFKGEEETKYKPLNVATISGKLICKKTAEGTLSAGVIYFIRPSDHYKLKWDEVLVRKKTHLWQNDPQLHPFLDKMVKIKGDIIETRNSITVDCIEIEEL